MAFEIVFKKAFIKKLIKVQMYLEEEWGDRVARGFLNKIDRRIEILKQYPHIGVASVKIPGLRSNPGKIRLVD